jgi:hypothetical protein
MYSAGQQFKMLDKVIKALDTYLWLTPAPLKECCISPQADIFNIPSFKH